MPAARSMASTRCTRRTASPPGAGGRWPSWTPPARLSGPPAWPTWSGTRPGRHGWPAPSGSFPGRPFGPGGPHSSHQAVQGPLAMSRPRRQVRRVIYVLHSCRWSGPGVRPRWGVGPVPRRAPLAGVRPYRADTWTMTRSVPGLTSERAEAGAYAHEAASEAATWQHDGLGPRPTTRPTPRICSTAEDLIDSITTRRRDRIAPSTGRLRAADNGTECNPSAAGHRPRRNV